MIKNSSFYVSKINKSTEISCIGNFFPLDCPPPPPPPEKPRDMAFNPSVFKRLQRWQVSWMRSIELIPFSTPQPFAKSNVDPSLLPPWNSLLKVNYVFNQTFLFQIKNLPLQNTANFISTLLDPRTITAVWCIIKQTHSLKMDCPLYWLNSQGYVKYNMWSLKH